jgi:ribosomal protein S18 acetylase RimI-like enzyme
MSSYSVRLATVNDALGIAKVHVRTWQCAYKGQIPDSFLDNLSVKKRADGWEESLRNPDPGVYAVVVESDGKIVGWCTVGVSRDDDATKETGELHGIYVDPEFIGKGVGSALMEETIKILRKDGYKEATLWVLDSNIKTRNWYESKGWKVEGKKKTEPRDGFDLHETRYVLEL